MTIAVSELHAPPKPLIVRGQDSVGVFHWGVSIRPPIVGVPRGTVAWQPTTTRPSAVFDCAGASFGGRGCGWRVNTPLRCGRRDEHRFGATRPALTVDCAGARLGGRVPWGRVNTPTKFGLVGRKLNVRDREGLCPFPTCGHAFELKKIQHIALISLVKI